MPVDEGNCWFSGTLEIHPYMQTSLDLSKALPYGIWTTTTPATSPLPHPCPFILMHNQMLSPLVLSVFVENIPEGEGPRLQGRGVGELTLGLSNEL